MSERDFAMAFALLAEAFGEKHLTPVRIEAYHQSLQDVPIPLLRHAVSHAISHRTFFPKVAELRADAEACRKAILAEHPFRPCADCNYTGWDSLEVNGVKRVTRCDCWHSYRRTLNELGAGERPLLTAGEEFDPRMAQLADAE